MRSKSLIQHYIASHLSALQLSLSNFRAHPVSGLFSVLAIGLCLALPLGFYLVVMNVQSLVQPWENTATLNVYVSAQTAHSDIERIDAFLKRTPLIDKVEYINADSALAEFKASSHLDKVLEALPNNPLPCVFHVTFKSPAIHQEDLENLKLELMKMPGVIKAAYDDEWVQKMRDFFTIAKRIAFALLLMMGLGVVLGVSNTIRLSLEHHRDEIEVMHQIGATFPFILRPFLYRGVLYTTLGGFVALAALYAMYEYVQKPLLSLTSWNADFFHFENLGIHATVGILLGCAFLGWMGAMLAFYQQYHRVTQDGGR